MEIIDLGLTFNPLTPLQKVKNIVCHHPAHKTWTIEEIHNYHTKSKKWNGIGYNYFVALDGKVYKGRGRNQGAHVAGRNHDTLGVCFQGNFEEQEMTDEQVKSGGRLIAQLIREEGLTINDVIGHKDLAKTSCPGKNFRMGDLKQSILSFINPNVNKKELIVLKDWQLKAVNEALDKLEEKNYLPYNKEHWLEKAKKGQLTMDEMQWLFWVMIERATR